MILNTIQFNNKTNLPILVEYWSYEKTNITNYLPNKKINYNLDCIIIKPFQESKLYSLTCEWYVSSLFLQNDYENNNIWTNNNLPNEMICTFQNKLYSSNNNYIIMKSSNFDVKYNEGIISIYKI